MDSECQVDTRREQSRLATTQSSVTSERSWPPVARDETLGARLRRLRKERRIGVVTLARLVNVSRMTVWKWEADQVRPRQKSVEALASLFDVLETELLFGSVSDQQDQRSAPVNDTTLLCDLIRDCKRQIADVTGTSEANILITISA